MDRARDFWSRGRGIDSRARSLLVGTVSAETEFMVLPLGLCLAACKIVRLQFWDPSAI